MNSNFCSDENCLFCKIIKGEIPSTKVYESDRVIAFKDLNPVAPIHVLFVHKNHNKNINDMSDNSSENILDVFKSIAEFTKHEGLASANEGFRVITNSGVNGGQSVFHTHFHLLAGKRLKWEKV